MSKFNIIVIGNGYDISLGLDTYFSSFIQTQVNEKYVIDFLNNNKNYYIKKENWDPYHGSIVTEYHEFSSIFSDINNWNDLEYLIDSVYNYNIGTFTYEHIVPRGISPFMQKFSEMFRIWIKDKLLEEKPDNISHIEEYSEEDIIINLNFTDTIPEKYKNVEQVHKITDDYHYIGPYSIKEVHEDIIDNINRLEESIQGEVGAVYLFGVNMHGINVVDKHIIELLNDVVFQNQSNVLLNYININVNDKDKKRLAKRFDECKEINFIDSNNGTEIKITNPYKL